MGSRYRIGAGIVILNHKLNRVLILKSNSGYYTFPKGYVDKNEELVEAAIRETREETGIRLKSHHLLLLDDPYMTEYSYKQNGRVTYKNDYYYATLWDDIRVKPQKREIVSYLWTTPQNATKLFLAQKESFGRENARMLRDIIKYVKSLQKIVCK